MKEHQMSIYSNVVSAFQKRAQFNRTCYEIRNMPQDVAIDLGIFREDAAKIAAKAVYG